MHMLDLTGQVFGRWTVLGRGENTPKGQAMWLVRCVCGNEKTLKSIVLRRGLSQSCGCLNREVSIARSTKHGHATGGVISPTYWSWAGMVARCTNPNSDHYRYYGGRGVTVCERWLTGFAAFLEDMGPKPEGTSLDRRDNNGPYSPENCQWSTHTEQMRNKRNNRLLTFRGQTKTMAEWCVVTGINHGTLWDRLDNGWSVEAALSTPTATLVRPLPGRNP